MLHELEHAYFHIFVYKVLNNRSVEIIFIVFIFILLTLFVLLNICIIFFATKNHNIKQISFIDISGIM